MKKETLIKGYKKVSVLLDNMREDHISESSAQCAYYTILSFIPFIMLVITLIQYVGIKPEVLYDAISKIVPSSMSQMIVEIVREVYSKSIGTISISIIFVLWSAGQGLFALTAGLRTIFCSGEEKNKITSSYAYLRLKSLWQTIGFIVLVEIGLITLVFGNSLIGMAQDYFEKMKNYTILSRIVTEVILLFAIFIIFLLLYKFTGKTKRSFKSQVYGAIFGSITLNIISFIFSKFLYIFKGFSIMYGSLTTLMLIMMWTYSCFYTLFLGAEINKWLDRK